MVKNIVGQETFSIEIRVTGEMLITWLTAVLLITKLKAVEVQC